LGHGGAARYHGNAPPGRRVPAAGRLAEAESRSGRRAMSMPFVAAEMTTAVWAIVKVSVLMAAAALAHALPRRRTSAATRHMVWTLGIVGLLLLPLLSA